MTVRAAIGCLLALSAGCSDEGELPRPSGPAPLTDLDPDPDVVEVELVAAPAEVEILPGKRTPVWAYRDGADPEALATVPGPLLDVAAGQRVIVHLDNQLPEPTTIHWHGIRLPAPMDGTPMSQALVLPGERFSYEFVARDPGFYWYHPHIAADVQIERGLQAPLRVRGPIDDTIAVAQDRVLVLDDVKIEASGALAEDTTSLDLMMGRMGNVVLANGRRDGEIRYAAGSRERWRLVNSANGRFFNLELPGFSFLVIGWDGGLLEQPYQTDTLLIAPGERYEVLVELAGEPGSALDLRTLHYDRGHELPDPGPKTVLTVRFDPSVGPPAPLPASFGSFAPIAVSRATPVRPLVMSEEMDLTTPGAEPEFFFNGEKWPASTHVEATFGATEIWQIRNDAEMDHPFHLHGMFFQVLAQGGVPPAVRGNKDTVIVPMESTVTLAVNFDAAGEWMFHCHILEHAERGMMGMVMVY